MPATVKMLFRLLCNIQHCFLDLSPYTGTCQTLDCFKTDKWYELSESVTLDNSICKTKAHHHNNYPPHPERLPSTRPTAFADWLNSWLPGEKTQGLHRRPVLLLMGTISIILSKAEAPAQATMLWPTTNTCILHNVHWYFGTMTGTLKRVGRHHAGMAQTVRLLLVKGLKSVSAKLFEKSPQTQRSSVMNDRKWIVSL